MLPTKPICYSNNQRGFVLLSVIFAAIVIGIVALYQARLTQAEVQANQVQLTAERMHQWLQAAMAFYNEHDQWPASLDFDRYYAGTSTYTTQSQLSSGNAPQDYIDLDLVAQNFMPASVESYYGSTSNYHDASATNTPIPESSSDTAWAKPNARLEDNYLIVAEPPSNSFGCYEFQTNFDYRTDCQTPAAQPFKIAAYVPGQWFAQQIAAKLPNSWIEEPSIDNANRWVVHTSISRSSVQSTYDSIGDGSFVSGFLPMKRYPTGLHFVDKGEGWSTNSNQLAMPSGYGNTPDYYGGQNASSVYNKSPGSIHTYGEDNLGLMSFPTFMIPYNTQGDTMNACVNPGDQKLAPNFVVSTSGFNVPAVLEYPFTQTTTQTDANTDQTNVHKYINSTFTTGTTDTTGINYPLNSNNSSSYQYIGMGADCAVPSNISYPNMRCTSVMPYSSLYGLTVMSFERGANHQGDYAQFLLQVMGMSNQARGAIGYHEYNEDDANNGITPYADGLREVEIDDFLYDDNSNRQPTSGSFPTNHGSQDEANNLDHFWAWPQSQITTSDFNGKQITSQDTYESGVDGVNFFFYCNGKY